MPASKHILVVLLLMLFGKSFAQQTDDNNFYNEIKNYDISVVLMAKMINIEGEGLQKRAEPIGFIGDDFQRFFIHFSSVVKSEKNKYEYTVTGKTKVRETIRLFQGTLTIKKADLEKSREFPDYIGGTATCELKLYEDKKQSSTGLIQGEMMVGYILDSKKKMSYDAYLYMTDGFSNNTFRGTWTSYRTNLSKKCNWGDYRIPESGDLDIGAGEFSPNTKYASKGWKSYALNLADRTDPESVHAKKTEAATWWK
ncbi:hypothetical protein [Soonwooa sp.]|uniref:hypothetical protein n=1 Tax=Soonwooa sp. TaxID=1938592 RepID=UPI00262CEFF6|nr:hypothetical protein [Soonwooa sp.]